MFVLYRIHLHIVALIGLNLQGERRAATGPKTANLFASQAVHLNGQEINRRNPVKRAGDELKMIAQTTNKRTNLITARPGAIRAAGRVAGSLVVLSLLAGTAYAGKKLEREERHTVKAADHRAVVVFNPRGKTVIVGRDGASEVVVIATKIAKANTSEKTEELLARLHYEVREKDGVVVVRTVTDGMDGSRSFWSVVRGNKQLACVDYTIEVPRHFAVETASTSGDVRVNNVAGPLMVRATSGAIALKEIDSAVSIEATSATIEANDLQGDLAISATSGEALVYSVGGSFTMAATSGSVRVERVAGNAEVQLVTGDFYLEGCLGDVTFATSSGDAEILDVEGSVNAITSSGDIDVMILPIDGKEFMLSSSSGNIGVKYLTPEDYGFLLDVSTNSGSIEGDMPIKVEKISRRELKGVVGSGASRVMIETASGDIVIVENVNGKTIRKTIKKN